MKTKTPKKIKQRKGFAVMKPDQQLKICTKGGKATAKRHGRAHMSRIGKRGRAIRTKREREARKLEIAK